MVILTISNDDKLVPDQIRSWFKDISGQPSDVLIARNMEDAKKIIATPIISDQKHLDFIITDWAFGKKDAKEFLKWLRASFEIYSSKNFKLNSVPIILIEDTGVNVNAQNEGFDGLAMDFPANPIKYRETLRAAIKKWRGNLASDLQDIGLDPATKRFDNSYSVNILLTKNLKILSQEFLLNTSRRLDYVWQGLKIPSLEIANDQFEQMIKKQIRGGRHDSEKSFHKFLIDNPTFLIGENYKTNLYERHFYIDGTRKYVEPDFVNVPQDYSLAKPEIFEVKLKTQELVRPNQFRFVNKARRSIEQVVKYKNYMESGNPFNQKQIEKNLGDLFTNFQYTLLMGSSDEKDAHIGLIDKLLADFKFEEVSLFTYEELLERHIKLCERLREFDIFS